MYKLIFVFAVLVFFKGSHGETSLGKCPDVDPLPGFIMHRFLGLWYAIQATDKYSPCLSYYITQDTQHEGNYKITEIEQHTTVWSSVLHHEHNITGELSIPDQNKPGIMDLDLPLDIGTTTFTVFMTDFDNYAAIFTCKKYPLVHSWSVKILSRTRTLDMAFVDKIRTRLSSYNIDPFNLKIVSQKLCPKPGTKGSLVKTASNVATGVKNTVYNVVDSVEGTVKSYISDPKNKNTGEQSSDIPKTFDVRLNESTSSNGAKNIGETISNAAHNIGDNFSDFVGSFEEETAGVVKNVRDGASKVVNNVGEKFNNLTSKDLINSFGESISDLGENITSINKDGQ